jgi:hypothetical protein
MCDGLSYAYNDSKLTISGTGKTVTADCIAAFYSLEEAPWGTRPVALVKSVYIESGVEVLGEDAFMSQQITFISLPNTLKVIEPWALAEQGYLNYITLPASLRVIGERAFSMSALWSVDIPAGVEWIGGGAFSDTEAAAVTVGAGSQHFTVNGGALYTRNLSTLLFFPSLSTQTELVTPDATTRVEGGACVGARNLRRIELRRVTSIGYMGFFYCFAVVDLVLPPTLVDLDESALSGFGSLYAFDLPSSLTYVSDSCFEGCGLMPILELPDSVTRCGRYFVAECDSLAEIWLGTSVTTIGYSAFAYSGELLDIFLPDSITSLHPEVFRNSYLVVISMAGSVASVDIDIFHYSPDYYYNQPI